jgi:hypothetical protein
MTASNKTVLTAAAGVVALLIIGLGIGLGWSPWIIGIGVVVCGAFGTLIHVLAGRSPQNIFSPEPAPMPMPAPAPVVLPPTPITVVPIQGINLASATPDYDFTFDASVHWRLTGGSGPVERHMQFGARAVDVIIGRAADVAAGMEPGAAIRLQHRLNNVLGLAGTDPAGQVEAWADEVRISLSDADARRLRLLADVRKDVTVWEHQRRFECDKREYLGADVLSSTGSALVWWLSRNEENVLGAADLIGTMARLSAAARNEEIAELFRHLIPADLLPAPEPRFAPLGSDGAGLPFGFDDDSPRTPADLVTELMNALGLPDDQRLLFVTRVADGIEAQGDQEAADRLRRHFDVLRDEPQPEPAMNGTTAWPSQDEEPAAEPFDD